MKTQPPVIRPKGILVTGVSSDALIYASIKRHGGMTDSVAVGLPPPHVLPLVLHNELFSRIQPERMNYNFLCNCACPDDGFNIVAPGLDLSQPLRAAVTHAQRLPDQHHLHFSPQRAEGVAVLNAAAEEIRASFGQSRRLEEFGSDESVLVAIRDMAQLGLLEQADRPAAVVRRPSSILSTWIHVTNECNLRCDYCYINKTEDDMPEDVGRAAVDALFRSAEKNGFRTIKLKFAGGEATMNLKRVFAIHEYAQARSAETGIAIDSVILSNGVSIGPRAIEAFERQGLRVSISLDGVGDTHDAQRKFTNGRGSFAWVDRTLNKLISRGITPFISITLSGRNAAGLPDVIRYVLERDLPFNINFFRENDCAAPFGDLRLQDDSIIAAMRDAFAVMEARLPQRSLLGTLVDRAQFDQPHDKTCSVGDSYVVIDHKGNVAKCQMEIERPVATVWAEDPLAFIRNDTIGIQNKSVDEKEGCKACEWKYWCAGGCPALTFRTTGRYDVKSPNCRIYKALYPEMLRLEGLRLLKLNRRLQQDH